MICNMSRLAFFQQCRRKAKNMFIDGQAPLQTPDVLTIGGATHEGIAHLVAKRDREGALEVAEKFYRDRLEKEVFLPEERAIAEKNIEMVKRMVNAEADLYEKDTWTLLQPEVEFCVEVPFTQHHCIFIHELLHPNDGVRPTDNSCNDVRCYVNHRLKGRADGLISWKGLIWIIERKTSGLSGDLFWTQWQLASQPTAYIYGTWKGAGIKPNGFILEKITKPRKNASDPFHITIEREPFLRSDTDLQEFEVEVGQLMSDWEQAYLQNRWYKNTAACMYFNRRCFFHEQCKRNHQTLPGEFRQKDPDYVDAEYYKLLGLEPPVVPTTEVPVEPEA